MPDVRAGAPARVPGAPRRIPGGSSKLPITMPGGFQTRVPRQPTAGEFRQKHFQQIRDVRGQFAGGWGFAWVGLHAVSENIQNLNNSIHGSLREAAQQLADEMVQWAQANAPWQDQTGEARRQLQAGVVWEDEDHFTIFLGHGADIYYGIWLEVRFGGRNAIIVPTIMQFAPQLGAKIRTMA